MLKTHFQFFLRRNEIVVQLIKWAFVCPTTFCLVQVILSPSLIRLKLYDAPYGILIFCFGYQNSIGFYRCLIW